MPSPVEAGGRSIAGLIAALEAHAPSTSSPPSRSGSPIAAALALPSLAADGRRRIEGTPPPRAASPRTSKVNDFLGKFPPETDPMIKFQELRNAAPSLWAPGQKPLLDKRLGALAGLSDNRRLRLKRREAHDAHPPDTSHPRFKAPREYLQGLGLWDKPGMTEKAFALFDFNEAREPGTKPVSDPDIMSLSGLRPGSMSKARSDHRLLRAAAPAQAESSREPAKRKPEADVKTRADKRREIGTPDPSARFEADRALFLARSTSGEMTPRTERGLHLVIDENITDGPLVFRRLFEDSRTRDAVDRMSQKNMGLLAGDMTARRQRAIMQLVYRDISLRCPTEAELLAMDGRSRDAWVHVKGLNLTTQCQAFDALKDRDQGLAQVERLTSRGIADLLGLEPAVFQNFSRSRASSAARARERRPTNEEEPVIP